MTNYEKYKDTIKRLWELNFLIGINKDTNAIENCCEVPCENCKFSHIFNHGLDCHIVKAKWLMAEYKEPEIDWANVPIDTPILIRNYDDTSWQRRYFAGLNNEGYVTAWNNGRTSWTNEDKIATKWNYAKLAENNNI